MSRDEATCNIYGVKGRDRGISGTKCTGSLEALETFLPDSVVGAKLLHVTINIGIVEFS